MPSKQLVLFGGLDAKQMDTSLYELTTLIFDLKYLALVTELSVGRNRIFDQCLDASLKVADLAAELSDLSLRFIDWTEIRWRKQCHYEPYYPALEPRSYPELYETALRYESGCNAILLRLGRCLEKGGIKRPKEFKNVVEAFKTIIKDLKYESRHRNTDN